MITVLVPTGAGAGDVVELDETEAHHLRVRRAGGEPVAVRDGAGLVGTGELAASGRHAAVRIDEALRIERPPPLVLAVGAGDRERFAMLAEKAAELGVTSLVPIETERSRSVGGRVRREQTARLRRRALEAIKQSGAAWAPDVAEPVALEAFLERRGPAGAALWLADAEGAPPPPMVAADAAVAVVIGPEGGLTDTERAAAAGAGYVPTALGPSVLRFETAAIAAAVAANLARRRGAQ